jgi:hypothetical protein
MNATIIKTTSMATMFASLVAIDLRMKICAAIIFCTRIEQIKRIFRDPFIRTIIRLIRLNPCTFFLELPSNMSFCRNPFQHNHCARCLKSSLQDDSEVLLGEQTPNWEKEAE